MKNLTRFRPEDVITDVFKSVSFKSVLYCRSELRAPWGFSVAAHGMAGWHAVTQGKCWLRVGRDKAMTELGVGDVVILTRGEGNSIRSIERVTGIHRDTVMRPPQALRLMRTRLRCGRAKALWPQSAE